MQKVWTVIAWCQHFINTFVSNITIFCNESDVRRHREIKREGVQERLRDKLNTCRASDAEVACEVLFECIENSRHVPLHFIQTDDVFHQRRINIHLS